MFENPFSIIGDIFSRNFKFHKMAERVEVKLKRCSDSGDESVAESWWTELWTDLGIVGSDRDSVERRYGDELSKNNALITQMIIFYLKVYKNAKETRRYLT